MRIADRFEVGEQIGSGGMATVCRATDRRLRREVVIKRLHPHLASAWEASERFKHEALAAAALSHPGVVQVFDAGEDEQGPYIVMEFVEGGTLGSLLQGEGRLAPIRAAQIAAQVAEALHHAHQRRVIHRDVKPNNILIDASGRVKLGDFGIARSLEATHGLTGTGTLIGTVGYMAPERASGEEATPASDIYSLGVVLYRMLTGVAPFTADSPVAVAVAHVTSHPEPPSRLAPIPLELESVVVQAMAKNPNERFASAGQMAEALHAWLAAATSEQPPAEAIRGPTLATAGSSLNRAQIIEVGVEVADALAALHRAGAVHGDVRPANVLMSTTGARLTGPGITHDANGITHQGEERPARSYASPEVLAGHPPTHESDVFSLAAVLYELLAGQPPFHGTDRATSPPPLDDSTLDELLREALSSEPGGRPDASSLAAGLRACAPTHEVTAAPSVSAASNGSTLPMERPHPPADPDPHDSPSRPGLWWIIGLGVVLAGLTVYAIDRGVGQEPATTTPETTPLTTGQPGTQPTVAEETPTMAPTTTSETAQSGEELVVGARSDLEAALAAAHSSDLNPHEAREVMAKVDQAIGFIEDGNRAAAAQNLREVTDTIEAQLDGDIEESALNALTRLAQALGVSLDDNDD